MSIIKLKNVSKFYYSKGVVAIGFSKVNIKFDMGEFVAITGESGSGKSTLLNVISGLDSYEEGEMYINGEETSHYTEQDFENYRRKYVGNIFQNFNLVNSYTVYQNIELVLLLNGSKKSEVKKEVLDLIKQVDLYKFRNTKVSKLSGGQKQRVAIARALAKDTPIIIADEPTGNLDSKSAKEVIKLLSDVAKDKLVIVVTHNYEQIEKYVTRKVKMHDGKILEDKKIKQISDVKEYSQTNFKDITKLNRFRLAFRNTFNILPKFLLLFIVYLFVTASVITEYAGFKEQEYLESVSGENYIFSNASDKRIVIRKNDKSEITDEDYESLKKLSNVDYVVTNDTLLDSSIELTNNDEYWIDGYVNNIENFRGTLDVGRMPENNTEVIIEGNKNDYYLGYAYNEILDKQLYVSNPFNGETLNDVLVTIVGIKYNKTSDYTSVIYISDEIINKLSFNQNEGYSRLNALFLNKYAGTDYESPYFFALKSNSNVPKGEVYISSDFEYQCPDFNCVNQPLKIEISNIYYSDELNLKVTKTYNKNNMKYLLGLTNYDLDNGYFYINPDDYNGLFNRQNYQSSVFVKDVSKIDETVKQLKDMGYAPLALKDTMVSTGVVQLIRVFKSVVTIILVFVLFFIAYFVIKLILKSRNKYFSTIRILGATKKISKQLLVMELLIVSNIAYFAFLLRVYLSSKGIWTKEIMTTIITYFKFSDYLILYIILMLMSYLISQKYSKKLFKKSVITTIGEEV